MKSPVPFIKPQSYYTSPIKSNIIKDTVMPQFDPTPQSNLISQSIKQDQDIIKVDPQESIIEKTPKLKKSKPIPAILES
jgi:hypothetical protein